MTVHQTHARKMVKARWRTRLLQVPYARENTEGGHGGAADNKQRPTCGR